MRQTERGAESAVPAAPVVPARPVDPPSPRSGEEPRVHEERAKHAADGKAAPIVEPKTSDHSGDRSADRSADSSGDRGPDRVKEHPAERHPKGGQAPTADEVSVQREHLFTQQEADGYRERWHRVQGCFVDNPGASVEEADKLVTEAMKSLSERKQTLESWRSNGAQTEELRHALRDYRAFLDRLLRV